MSSDKPSSAMDEGIMPSVPPKPSFWARMKTHFRRFWWAHAIVVITVTLVVVLPVVYVAYPRIAQKDVNAATITVEKIDLSNPTPDSLYLNQTQVLGSSSPFHPIFFSFQSNVSLAGSPAPFITVDIPQIKAVNGAIIKVTQSVDLTGRINAFTDFCKTILLSEKVSMILYGRPQLKLGRLPTVTMTFNKTVTLTGLNQLKGFELKDYTLLTTKQPDGANMKGTVVIPNPSVLTIPMGNVSLDLFIDGEPVGQSFIDNLTLRPGSNIFSMRSKANQTRVAMIASTKYSSDWNVPFDIVGSRSVYNGQELPYFTAALQATKLHVTLNVLKLLGGGR